MKTIINIKADKEVKERAKQLSEELGLPLSAVVNAYLKEFIRSREVRFSIEPQPRPRLEKLLAKATSDYKNKKNVAGPFKTIESAIRYLES